MAEALDQTQAGFSATQQQPSEQKSNLSPG